MRYSFHGKVRATGQQVDGFVEAETASQAIDRLADKGIIGVYSVRPEARVPKNSVILSGEADPEEAAVDQRRLERASSKARHAPAPAPVGPPVQHQLPAPPAVVSAGASAATEASLTQLVDKLSMLLVQVEKLLARPQQVIYQSGPARGNQPNTKRSSRIPTEMQNNTLRDIFQTNLDLRQSLEKLANTVGPPPAPRPNGEPAPMREVPNSAREPIPHARERVPAQPAA